MAHNMIWRNKLLNFIKKHPHKVVAEVGVARGVTTELLLKNLPDIKLYYCVDPWIEYSGYNLTGQDMFNGCHEETMKRIGSFQDKTEVLKMTSESAAPHIKDESLDFVFIDANHAYEYVKQDIALWVPKVKIGGVVSGHDYTGDQKAVRYGVKRAVDELFKGKFELMGTIWHFVKDGTEI